MISRTTTGSSSGDNICFALPNHRVDVKIALGQALFCAAPNSHHLTHHAQRDLLWSRRPEVEPCGSMHGSDLFFTHARVAEVIQHQPGPVAARNKRVVGGFPTSAFSSHR